MITEEIRIAEFAANSPLDDDDTMRLVDDLCGMGYFKAPASTKYHSNYEGGLFDHSMAVFNAFISLSDGLTRKWERPESPFLIAFLHDLCKVDAYKINDDGTIEHANDCLLSGHGEKSVMMLHKLHLDFTEEEIACIRYHMGAFTDKEEWKYYTNAIHKYPNVLWTHTADIMATHLYEM